MRSRLLAFCLLLLGSSSALAQYRAGLPKPEPAQNVVREFCRQDFLGGRLSPDGWARMKSLVAWKDNPAWHEFRVVSRYEQTSASSGIRGARVTVQYQVMGRFELGIGYTEIGESENVEFKLKENDDEWRIDSTDPDVLAPRISKARALQWLQEKHKTTSDTAEKISIETALKQLQGK